MKTILPWILLTLFHIAAPITKAATETNEFALPPDTRIGMLVYGKESFVGIGAVKSIGAPITFHSIAGQTWTTNSSPDMFDWIAFDSETFLAISKTNLWKSTDAVSWTKVSTLQNPYSPSDPIKMRVSGNLLLVTDDCGKTHTSTSGGVSWLYHQNPSDCGSLFGAINSGIFLTADATQPAQFSRSEDGVSWTSQSPFSASIFRNLLAGNGLFTAFLKQSDGYSPLLIRTSQNGQDWDGSILSGLTTDSDIQAWKEGGYYMVSAGVQRRDLINTNEFINVRQLFMSTDLVSWRSIYELPPNSVIGSPAFGSGAVVFTVDTFAGANYVVRIGPFEAAAPVIDREPQPLQVYPGEASRMTVIAFGSGSLRYQWFKGNVAIIGATKSFLQFPSVTADDEANYEVEVSNDVSNVRSAKAHLSVTWLRVRNYAGLDFDVPPGTSMSIEAATSTAGPWAPLTNIVVPTRPFTWVDFDSPGTNRFYRGARQ
jgi:hypothetical protein